MCRQRRLGANDAAFAFEAFKHRGFFAADVATRANVQIDIEVEAAVFDVVAEPTGTACRVECARQYGVRERILGTEIDVAFTCANRETGYRHAFDQPKRVAFHQQAIGKRTAVAFVRIAGDVFLLGVGIGNRAPLDAGRESGTAAPAQARVLDRLQHHFGPVGESLLQCFETLVLFEVLQ